MIPSKLYTREQCPLCDEAYNILASHGFLPEVIDIDRDPILQAKYTNCVPVVEIDGKVRFRGRINEVLLRRIKDAGR